MAEPRTRIVRIFVDGRVQGVGYRAFFVREAARLGFDGWVRNRLDGRVEAVVSGPGAAIDALLAAARRGPIYARVEAVHAEDADAAALQEGGGGAPGFSVAPTV
jgi:acylphosphatase